MMMIKHNNINVHVHGWHSRNLCDRVLEGNQKTGFSSRMQILQAMDDGMDRIVGEARDRTFVPRFFVALLLCVQSHDDAEILARVLRTLAHVLHVAQYASSPSLHSRCVLFITDMNEM
jgi:hypothetical protein